VESSSFEPLTLVAAVVGAAVLGAGSHAMGAAMGDIAILLCLFAFDGVGARSGAQSIAFAGVSGFCVLTPLFFLASNVLGATPPSDANPWLLFGVWAVATLILFGVDRFRMSALDNVSLGNAGLAGAAAGPMVISTPPTSYRPAPIQVQTPPALQYEAVPPPVAPAPTQYQAPAPTAYAPPPAPLPVAVPAYYAEAAAAPMAAPMATPSPVLPAMPPPVPDVTAIPPGREALIYLNLVGEGLNVLRTVRAENLGRDYYRIADIMPENERWEFTPGQVVKCRKKALSNGKHMVAYEEAPRA
jgi:hypothetical protein